MKFAMDLLRNQKGMTGLETAIILIAFVTVAAVFGYAVLSAGLFSAEQGKETIYAGLNEATSNLELTGSVVGKAAADNTSVLKDVIFTLKAAPAGNPVDMTACDGTGSATNKCSITLTTSSDYISNVKWSRTFIGTNSTGNMLAAGDQCVITVNLCDLGDSALTENLTANSKFSLQVKPNVGATITIERTLPGSLETVMDLH